TDRAGRTPCENTSRVDLFRNVPCSAGRSPDRRVSTTSPGIPRMRLFQPDNRQRRTLGALFGISLVIAVLLTAFYNTQVVRGEVYSTISEGNRLRPVVIPAPRGTIYDRYGEVVATSIPGFSVVLLPGSEEAIQATLNDLQPFLGLADTDIARVMEQRAASPHGLLTITEDATFSQIAALEERRASFPNLLII